MLPTNPLPSSARTSLRGRPSLPAALRRRKRSSMCPLSSTGSTPRCSTHDPFALVAPNPLPTVLHPCVRAHTFPAKQQLYTAAGDGSDVGAPLGGTAPGRVRPRCCFLHCPSSRVSDTHLLWQTMERTLSATDASRDMVGLNLRKPAQSSRRPPLKRNASQGDMGAAGASALRWAKVSHWHAYGSGPCVAWHATLPLDPPPSTQPRPRTGGVGSSRGRYEWQGCAHYV